VLDDYSSEASEIYKHNKWLNYGLPLHRMREMGCNDRLFDLLDERPLTVGEIRDFCVILFGQTNMDGIPDPAVEWSSFLSLLSRIQNREKHQWVSFCRICISSRIFNISFSCIYPTHEYRTQSGINLLLGSILMF